MKLIDTNIIMYAIGKVHPLKEPCREVLQKVTQGETDANIDVEVLQELLYVYSSRGERAKGIKVIEEMLVIFSAPFVIGRAEIERAKDLMKRYTTLTARDAIHCAIAINHNLEGIISTDKDLGIVTEIACFKP